MRNGFKIPFKSISPLSAVPISMSIFLPVVTRRDRSFSQETSSRKGTGSGNSRFLFLFISSSKKNEKLRPVIYLSLLNQNINKQLFMMETVKSVRQSIMVNDWAVSIDLTDAYLHVPIHPISIRYQENTFGSSTDIKSFNSRPYPSECP